MNALHVRSFGFAAGALWGLAVLTVGLANMAFSGYGQAFLEVIASIYPGYHPEPTLVSSAIGGLYAAFDGLIGGAVFAWLYNRFAGKR